MAQSREDRVYMAYRVYKARFQREGSKTPRAHAILVVCGKFSLSVDEVRKIVNARTK